MATLVKELAETRQELFAARELAEKKYAELEQKLIALEASIKKKKKASAASSNDSSVPSTENAGIEGRTMNLTYDSVSPNHNTFLSLSTHPCSS